MRVFKAVGRFLSNPLCAAVICLGGGYAIWLSVPRQPGGAPTAKPGGTQRPGNDKTADRRTNGDGPGARAATEGGEKRHAPAAGIAAKAKTTAGPRKSRAIAEEVVQHFEAENEPLDTKSKAAAATTGPKPAGQRPDKTVDESATASVADVIGPLDPRAPALTEYQTKKAAIVNTAAAQKELAVWCDQNGLWDTAKTHWTAVTRLDAKNEEARKRLGYRLRDGAWFFDTARADDVAQKKANSYWKVLERYHRQMKCKSKVAGPGRAEAVAHIEAVGDPRAARSIWNEFSANVSHHGLMVGILSRFKTSAASQMLAALAVYSQDEKARVAAVAGLQGRAPAEYGEKLVSLMRFPMRVEERQVPIPGRAPARLLFVEGDTENYQFLFSHVEAPTPESWQTCFPPPINVTDVAMARQFNANQVEIAKQGMKEQIAWAKAMIKAYNDSIQALNQRVASVLNEGGGAGIRADAEDGRRWLATTLGIAYQPTLADQPKPTITEFVSPLYSPTFLPLPVSS